MRIRGRRRRKPELIPRYDPGRERRAERRARELMQSMVSEREYEMYEELGFISVDGRDHGSGYAYLLYPHRPIVAYATGSGELLNEYCIAFRDDSDPAFGTRLPDADDVLAKWISISADERNLIARANMHVPGRQIDPDKVRRDLHRLRAWRATKKVVA